MTRYFAILIVWCLAWYLPSLAGDFWDDNLQVYNAIVSAFLIFAVLKIHRCWWTLDLACICALQVLFNAYDLFRDMPPERYNIILTLFNAMEIGIILFLGLPSELIRKWYGKHSSHGHHSDSVSREIANGLPRNGHV